MRYIDEELKIANLFASTAVIVDISGAGISVEGYEDDAEVILTTGLIDSTNCTFAINVQASTALAGAYTTIGSFTTITATDDYKIAALPISLKGTDRKYIRLNVDATLAASATLIHAIIGAQVLLRPTVLKSGLNSSTLA